MAPTGAQGRVDGRGLGPISVKLILLRIMLSKSSLEICTAGRKLGSVIT